MNSQNKIKIAICINVGRIFVCRRYNQPRIIGIKKVREIRAIVCDLYTFNKLFRTVPCKIYIGKNLGTNNKEIVHTHVNMISQQIL